MNKASASGLILPFLLFMVSSLTAQTAEQDAYEILLLEMELIESYQSLPEEIQTIILSAKELGDKGDYEIALVYLEEAMSKINLFPAAQNLAKSRQKRFNYNIISGIDYNRNEFELGLSQQDSTLLDEISKPYIGIGVTFLPVNRLLKLENVIRYDKENFQLNLNLASKVNFGDVDLDIKLGGLYDRNFTYNYLGYQELYSDIQLRETNYLSDWYWNIRNSSRLKAYKNQSESIPDFFRNSVSIYLLRNLGLFNSIQLVYNFDINESIDYENNDFIEHSPSIRYQNVLFGNIKYSLESRYRFFDYAYTFNDSLSQNNSSTFILEPQISFLISSLIHLNMDYEADIKQFKNKTEQEPDYQYHYLNPFITWNFNALTSVSMGYVYEIKNHKTQNGLDNQYIEDQNYRSQGVKTEFDFTSESGILVSLSAEYTQRRYTGKESSSFSIYSNRNILNILLFSQWPLTNNLNMSAIGSYDNDEDLDIDFNNSVSSFFSIELSYNF